MTGQILGWNKAFAIVPSDTVDLASVSGQMPTHGVYVGGAGNVTGVLLDGTTALFTAPPVGSIIPVQFKRINATGTTATLLVGLAAV